jgi:RNA polymerase sigma-70 factor (ECF subfamily)
MFLMSLFGSEPAKIDDAALLAAILRGETPALENLYDRYSKLVFSLAYQVTGDSGVAEEITQEVFLQVWNKAHTYHSAQGKVIAWLTGITRNRSIDALRRRNVRPEGHTAQWQGEDEPDIEDPASLEEQVDLRVRSAEVRHALQQLPTEQREMLALAYFKGMTQQEIAGATGEPLGTVKTRIRLAMIKLRQLLLPEGE